MSVFILKILALIFMIIDHIGYFFIKNDTYIIYRIIGRMAAPIFLFLFVEGYLKTSNRKKYQYRLLFFSIIMFIGNFILSLFFEKMYPINTNIIWTMFLCSLFLTIIENKNFNIYKKIFMLFLLLFPIYFSEYSFIALFNVLFFYIYLKQLTIKKSSILIKTIFVNFYIVFFLIYCLIIKNIIQYFMIFSLFFILLYNFKLGKKNKYIQYFYYFFYIIHLWLFVLFIN